MSYAVDVRELTVAYDERIVLDQISWQVKAGSLAAVIGPNGGGKSTLLKSLLHLIKPVSGKIRIFIRNRGKLGIKLLTYPRRKRLIGTFPSAVSM